MSAVCSGRPTGSMGSAPPAQLPGVGLRLQYVSRGATLPLLRVASHVLRQAQLRLPRFLQRLFRRGDAAGFLIGAERRGGGIGEGDLVAGAAGIDVGPEPGRRRAGCSISVRHLAFSAKYGEIEESWKKLAAHWERSARRLDETIAQQAQLTQAKHRSNRNISAVECNGSLSAIRSHSSAIVCHMAFSGALARCAA